MAPKVGSPFTIASVPDLLDRVRNTAGYRGLGVAGCGKTLLVAVAGAVPAPVGVDAMLESIIGRGSGWGDRLSTSHILRSRTGAGTAPATGGGGWLCELPFTFAASGFFSLGIAGYGGGVAGLSAAVAVAGAVPSAGRSTRDFGARSFVGDRLSTSGSCVLGPALGQRRLPGEVFRYCRVMRR